MNQREIAKLAGVSTATVSRVVNGDVSVAKTTKEHVLKIIDQYSYVQNINARNLRASSSKAIGFLISKCTKGWSLFAERKATASLLEIRTRAWSRKKRP